MTEATQARTEAPLVLDPSIVIDTSDRDFLQRWVYENPHMSDRGQLVGRWITDPTPREDVASALGISLGALLRSFNDTAPLEPPLSFRYRRVPFSVVAMRGICDDLAGDRYPMFGEPVTLRCHLESTTLLPQGMFEAADWNFMDGGRPGFVGYAYGVRFADTLYLAGLQSDLGVRYGYLFQGRGGTTEVRMGDIVVQRAAADVAADYERYVPALRRAFQRYWIAILLAAGLTWARQDERLTTLGLLQFFREPQESTRGHVVHRVYQDLPERLGAGMREVVIGEHRHRYAIAPWAAVERFLGDRWQCGHG